MNEKRCTRESDAEREHVNCRAPRELLCLRQHLPCTGSHPLRRPINSMSSDGVGGTGAANSNRPRGGPLRRGERKTERGGDKWRHRRKVGEKDWGFGNNLKQAWGGNKDSESGWAGREERSSIVDVDSTRALAAG